ncbi:MAG: hypothetical protein ACK48Y_23835, partial [Planctomyces sp.]
DVVRPPNPVHHNTPANHGFSRAEAQPNHMQTHSLLLSDANASEKPTEDFHETGLSNLFPDSWQSVRSEKRENMGNSGCMLLFFRKKQHRTLCHAGIPHTTDTISRPRPSPAKRFLK